MLCLQIKDNIQANKYSSRYIKDSCIKLKSCSRVFPLQQRTMSLTQSVWCSIDAMYGSCWKVHKTTATSVNFQFLKITRNNAINMLARSKYSTTSSPFICLQHYYSIRLAQMLNEGLTDWYLVLVDTPYPDDGVSTSSEEPVKSWVQL